MLEPIESGVRQTAACGAALRDFMTADDWGWTYAASRDELLAAGVCTPAHFPEGKKRSASNYSASSREWELTKLKGGLWKLRVYRTRDEMAEFKRLQQVKHARHQRFDVTEGKWKENRARLLDMFLDGLSGQGVSASFQLSETDQDAMQALAQRMLMVLNAAKPERIETPHDDEIAEPKPVLRTPLRLAWSSTPASDRIDHQDTTSDAQPGAA